MQAPLPLRAFQSEIVELARDQNVVMVGETGIGKTFVAIALLSEQDYSGGKRAFFLAPTRQLVWQITSKIRLRSTLNANAYCGHSMEQWGPREWSRELAITRVFVCTPEVLRNALERGFVQMKQINLLVFDECHHVTKRHPYAHVIKMYDPDNRHEMPRVFGTTACPTKDCAANLYAQMHKVELQKDETIAYAATAPILFETYDKPDDQPQPQVHVQVQVQSANSIAQDNASPLDQWMAQELRGTVYETLLAVLMETKAMQVLQLLLKKGRSDASRDDARCDKLVRKFVLSCVEIFRVWGLWCVYKFIHLEIERAAINASLLMPIPGSFFGYDSAAVTALMITRRRLSECNFAATKRLEKVVELLTARLSDSDDEQEGEGDEEDEEERKEKEEDEEHQYDKEYDRNDDDELQKPKKKKTKAQCDMQGIVFVTTRAECRVVCEFFNERLEDERHAHPHAEDDDDEYESSTQSSSYGEHGELYSDAPKDPRFGCVLGQAATRDTASFNLPRMEETLSKFEKGSIQFLVSTSVSCEGVDFPQCSLIIVADRIQAARKLVQLRGRARHEDGVVYYLAEKDDFAHETHFKVMMVEAEAINALDFRHDKQETILQQPRSQAAQQLVGFAFFPDEAKIVIEETGAVLDLDSSVSRINMFCQTLPPQLFTVDYKNMYTFTQEEVFRRPMFRARLQLPIELEIPPFTTGPLHSKATAKATAAFQGCKYLLENFLLDNSLNSVYRKGKSTAGLATDNLSYFLNRLHT